jgi:ABC-2 type transport system permease protein
MKSEPLAATAPEGQLTATPAATDLQSGHRLAANIWQRELVEFSERRLAMLIKLTFPLLVALPLVLSQAPGFYAAMALTMLVAVVGSLGSGAVLTRERTTGLVLRYRLLPLNPQLLLLERLAVNATIDWIQLLPALVLIAARRPAEMGWWPALAVTAAAVLLMGNVLGALASTFSSSPGEVMLVTFFPLLPALYLSGVFVPLSGGLLILSRFLPFTYLHESLLGSLGGAAGMTPWQALVGGLVFLGLAVGLSGLMARRILETD